MDEYDVVQLDDRQMVRLLVSIIEHTLSCCSPEEIEYQHMSDLQQSVLNDIFCGVVEDRYIDKDAMFMPMESDLLN